MCILEADSPLAEYRKITDEILKRMLDEDRYPRHGQIKQHRKELDQMLK
ncbi:hypothetical protein G9X64_20000 [Rhizobium sophorae]|uniref:Uncharacterized protein n=1 Tax=Rhizobium sophorae TaxID=1535242 RepID=A0A7Y3S8W1_9HYPH|nr:hypothetical protein [Rhizobium sophorae]MBX4863166.1 hypothetical protein [Rhizobium bangladeshense]NNU38720.1 hypothetical protein [Rhizobium sophorae]